MRHNTLHIIILTMLAILTARCAPSLPTDAADAGHAPHIYPDYTGVTVPVNIAPLNFSILDSADEYVTHIHLPGTDGICLDGSTVDIDPSDWSEMLEQARGGSIEVDVYARTDGRWSRFTPFTIEVAEEIDPYISYRLIEPSYVNYEVMRINQRCLENFDESEIFNNCAYSDAENGQCINCHSYQNYNADGTMQMHVRANHGGTLIVRDGEVTRVDLKRPYTISAGAYPAWHPTLPLIAYSNNLTQQAFHTADSNKIEVYDNDSDLMLYDTDTGNVTMIANDSTELETFPAWSPDGKWLYYASASIPAMDAKQKKRHAYDNYKEVKYDLYRLPFDAGTRTFGAIDTVYRATADSLSAALPRLSPDGRYLLFSMAPYGTFHIWHHDADLYLMDLTSGEARALDALNSPDTESYHSWSSNGRWILFSSRRDDGSYTRLYIAYFDKDGRAHKPFMLPQHDPAHNTRLYKSYNVPEFMTAPVTVPRDKFIEALAD